MLLGARNRTVKEGSDLLDKFTIGEINIVLRTFIKHSIKTRVSEKREEQARFNPGQMEV